MNNIPPLTPRERRNAPWNQRYPEADERCPHCGAGYLSIDVATRAVELTDLAHVKHEICPDCGNVVHATLIDETAMYHDAWRTHREEMEKTIDTYAELRGIELVPRADR